MTGNGWGIAFLVSLTGTVAFCWNGDDDIVYKFFERKPTGEEAIKRIRFVLAKFITVMSGAVPLIFLFVRVAKFRLGLSFSMSQNKVVIAYLLSMAAIWAVVGVAQNQIRRFQGRIPRPLFDLTVARFNLMLWIRPRK